MNKLSLAVILSILFFTAQPLSAQKMTAREAAQKVAVEYMKAWRSCDFETAKKFATEDTWEKLDMDQATFNVLSTKEQKKMLKGVKGMTIEPLTVINLFEIQDDFDPYDDKIVFMRIPMELKMGRKKKEYQDCEMMKVNGQWLAYDPLPEQRKKNEYKHFRKFFTNKLQPSFDEYMIYGLNEQESMPMDPYAAFGINTYAQGYLTGVNGMNLYVVRIEIPGKEEDNYSTYYEDRLYFANDSVFLPIPAVTIGAFAKLKTEQGYTTEQSWWFGWDGNLHTRTLSDTLRDGAVPYIQELTRAHEIIEDEGVVAAPKEETADTIYIPEDYAQFRSLFFEFAVAVDPLRLGTNKFFDETIFDPETENLYTLYKVEDNAGLDIFFVKKTLRAYAPTVEDFSFNNASYMLAFDQNTPGATAKVYFLGQDTNSETGGENYDYWFESYDSMRSSTQTIESGLATGYDIPIYTTDENRYEFHNGKIDTYTGAGRIYSEFFELGNARTLKIEEAITEKNPFELLMDYRNDWRLYFYYKENKKGNSPDLHFVTKDMDGQIVISKVTVRSKKKTKTSSSPSDMDSEPFLFTKPVKYIIETSEGYVFVDSEGKLSVE